MALRSKVVG